MNRTKNNIYWLKKQNELQMKLITEHKASKNG